MQPFHSIAVPHRDILEGRLTQDVFAADLWEVFKGRGPDEYKDPTLFFRKTYLTEGITNLLEVVENRIKGKGGDPVIQIQTPFGGGKTHALITIYHSDWDARKVVIAGTSMGPTDTLWGTIEQQLTGKIEKFRGLVSPGGEALYRLLAEHQPVVILMDEVLQYVTKAAGIKVEKSTLSAQTIAFMQELTKTAGTLEKTVLLLTLPSSVMEHYDEEAERLFIQLQHVVGRVEKIYTPVQENEINQVIRQRLFSKVDVRKASQVVQSFMDYVTNESILPPGTEPSEYRKRFEASYPFLPEVVEVLYHRWGSFPNFQRTRGVLRLLSLVIHSLKSSGQPYISLANFDLGNPELFRDLLKHIGQEFDSVAASDIFGEESGAKKVDLSLGDAYKGLKLGTRTAVSIFLHSFSGGVEKGATLGEIKRCATTMGNPAGVIAEALEQLRNTLFYLQVQGGKYLFTNQPNLNRVLLIRMENVEEREMRELETELLKKNLSGKKLKVAPLFPKSNGDVPDTPELKLIVLPERDNDFIREIMEKKGATPRVHRNTLFFLTPIESEKAGFRTLLTKTLAYQQIGKDQTLNLSEEQKKEVRKEFKKLEESLNDGLRRYYRQLIFPSGDGIREMDVGIPTYGDGKKLDEDVYDKLRSGNEILEKIAPLVIREKYLKTGDGYVSTEQLYQSSLKTPGEARAVSREVWEKGIQEGVRQGLFGLGELEDGTPVPRYFKAGASVSFSGNEILLKAELCRQEESKEPLISKTESVKAPGKGEEAQNKQANLTSPSSGKNKLVLSFTLPRGKVSGLLGILNLLQTHFKTVNIDITATEGGISPEDYEDKVMEAFRQLGIVVDD